MQRKCVGSWWLVGHLACWRAGGGGAISILIDVKVHGPTSLLNTIQDMFIYWIHRMLNPLHAIKLGWTTTNSWPMPSCCTLVHSLREVYHKQWQQFLVALSQVTSGGSMPSNIQDKWISDSWVCLPLSMKFPTLPLLILIRTLYQFTVFYTFYCVFGKFKRKIKTSTSIYIANKRNNN